MAAIKSSSSCWKQVKGDQEQLSAAVYDNDKAGSRSAAEEINDTAYTRRSEKTS